MTMFNNKFVVAIKTAGKVLREQGDKVYLPFGSEYSIFLKNLNSVRALVRVSLDGKSVTDGEDLVIYGNSELNLERFLNRGNMESGNRFKFIERTAKVEQHRGIEAEDGLLRVEFQFEKVQPKPIVQDIIHKYHYPTPWYDPWYYPPYRRCWSSETYTNAAQPGDILYGSAGLNSGSVNNALGVSGSSASIGGSISGSVITNSANVGIPMNADNQVLTSHSVSDVTRSFKSSAKLTKSAMPEARAFSQQAVNDAGITVPGSVSDQKFQAAAWFAVDDEKFVIVLKLLGEVGGQVVEQPVLVRQKQTCSTCGTRNRGQNQFCRECGTALELVGQSTPKRRVQKR